MRYVQYMVTWGYEILNGYYLKGIKMGIDQTKIPIYIDM